MEEEPDYSEFIRKSYYFGDKRNVLNSTATQVFNCYKG